MPSFLSEASVKQVVVTLRLRFDIKLRIRMRMRIKKKREGKNRQRTEGIAERIFDTFRHAAVSALLRPSPTNQSRLRPKPQRVLSRLNFGAGGEEILLERLEVGDMKRKEGRRGLRRRKHVIIAPNRALRIRLQLHQDQGACIARKVARSKIIIG